MRGGLIEIEYCTRPSRQGWLHQWAIKNRIITERSFVRTYVRLEEATTDPRLRGNVSIHRSAGSSPFDGGEEVLFSRTKSQQQSGTYRISIIVFLRYLPSVIFVNEFNFCWKAVYCLLSPNEPSRSPQFDITEGADGLIFEELCSTLRTVPCHRRGPP